jgi:CubicO group peptidase (beta-lactamase class C family)
MEDCVLLSTLPPMPLLCRILAIVVWPALAAAQGVAPNASSARAAASLSSANGSEAFDPVRLSRIDAWLQKLIADRQIPGAVAMIVRDGRVAYHKAFGVRDLEGGGPIKTDDIFRIASQTKAITSLAVMMLWEEGRFGLDDPIGRYIPAFRTQTVLAKFNPADSSYESRPTTRRITIRQLLTHTSGLDYADIGSNEFKAIYAKAGITALGREGDVLADKIDALGKLPLKHDPGERFTYGLSLDVLGRLVEVLSGMPLDQFFRTRIFEPLGMKDTYFGLPPEKTNRLVSLHQMRDGKLVSTHDDASNLRLPTRRVTYFSGGGGLSGTTADYARFLQLFLNGGELDGKRLLGRKTVELMLTNQIGALQPPFGLGFQVETPEEDFKSPSSIGTFSWGGAFNTSYWADPKERLVALIFTNTYGAPVSLGGPFKVFVYSALK